MATIQESLKKISDADGVFVAVLVDTESGMALGSSTGANVDGEADRYAAAITDVVRSQLRFFEELNIQNDRGLEDFLITSETGYSIVRNVDEARRTFIYVAADRSRANLGLVRMITKDAASSLTF